MINTHFCHNKFDVTYDIFKAYCMPLHSSQLCNYGKTYIDRFFVCWRKAIRKLLNFPYSRTPNELLPYICDDVKQLIQVLRRVISFIKSASHVKNELSELCYKLALHGSGSAISNNVSIICMVCPA